ncbi:hypothetical protein [Motiliproteus sp. MSK22-1]|uniref:hypothetical protein n=1 Tax=Motiliproteus sp. MSK22-1 TaxID=1897630 RepID=UPI0009780E75|nr:hypothetical protein [Motiliproteus sp. MSK22-1]OMH31957.1 hypothetical protein BGP75_16075 [Motiliproteus sp. MSK22-1]
MKRISEHVGKGYPKGFEKVWIGLLLLAVWLTNFHWSPIAMLVISIPWYILMERKTKEVHSNENSIFVKDGDNFEEINIQDIHGKIEHSHYLAGGLMGSDPIQV